MDVAVGPGGDYIASAGSDRSVRVWSTKRGEEVCRYLGPTTPVNQVAFDPQGWRLAACDYNGEVRVWDLTRSPEHLRLYDDDERETQIDALGFAAGGREIVALGVTRHEATFRRWHAETGFPIEARKLGADGGVLLPLRRYAFSADGARLACAHNEREIGIYDLSSAAEPCVLEGHRMHIFGLSFSSTGQLLASASGYADADRGEIIIWDSHTGAQRAALLVNGGAQSLAFSPDESVLACTGVGFAPAVYALDDRGLALLYRVSEIDDGEWRRTERPGGVAFSPDGRYLAFSTGSLLKILEARSGALVRRLESAHQLDFLTFHPDGSRLAGAGRDVVALWDVAAGQEALVLAIPNRRPRAWAFSPTLAFSQDGRRLVASNWNGDCFVWEAIRQRAEKRRRMAVVEERAFLRDVEVAMSGSRFAADRARERLRAAARKPSRFLSSRAQLYSRIGMTEEASATKLQEDIRRRTHGDEEAAEICFRARRLLEDGEHEAAVAAFRKLVERGKKWPAVFLGLAESLEARGQAESALALAAVQEAMALGITDKSLWRVWVISVSPDRDSPHWKRSPPCLTRSPDGKAPGRMWSGRSVSW